MMIVWLQSLPCISAESEGLHAIEAPAQQEQELMVALYSDDNPWPKPWGLMPLGSALLNMSFEWYCKWYLFGSNPCPASLSESPGAHPLT